MDFGIIAQSGWLDPSWWWAILQVVIGLGAVIFVHELGHFLVAKACGVKCEKFYVGFDAFDIKIGDRVLIPRRLVHWQWGETEYGVGILPLGGYVKMLGQDDNPSKMAEERQRAMMSEGDGVDGSSLDPRSYQAKTVPQRMAIISAGVVMNLIFAVIFASIAFWQGVNYEPPRVGSTIPGSPAWQNNLDGSTVPEINGKRTDQQYYTFQHFKETIVLDGYDGPLEMVFRRPGEQNETRESIMPARNLIGVKGGENLLALGIQPQVEPRLSQRPTLDGHAAEKADPPLEGDDLILAVDGEKVESEFELKRAFSKLSDRDVSLTIQRADGDKTKELSITLPRNPMRTIGLSMEAGPIRAMRKGSPAERAGIKVNDKIVAIDGDRLGDPFTLQQRMLQKARENEAVKITVRRVQADEQVTAASDDNSVELDFEVEPELPWSLSGRHSKNGISVESLGINLPIRNKIASLDFPVEKDGLRSGDVIVSSKIKLGERQKKVTYLSPLEKAADLETFPDSWAVVNSNFQNLDEGTVVELEIQRGDKTLTYETTVAILPYFFQETRGIGLQIAQDFYQDTTVWAAVQTGFRQTIYDASRVLKFLKKLFRGQLSIKHFGGPGTIAVVATSEATQGTSRLLLFLTLLSANLAIINFLPIPVLDGGHMVFLAYEGIFRRPVGEKIQLALTLVGFVFLLALMVTVIGLDIWRLS